MYYCTYINKTKNIVHATSGITPTVLYGRAKTPFQISSLNIISAATPIRGTHVFHHASWMVTCVALQSTLLSGKTMPMTWVPHDWHCPFLFQSPWPDVGLGWRTYPGLASLNDGEKRSGWNNITRKGMAKPDCSLCRNPYSDIKNT